MREASAEQIWSGTLRTMQRDMTRSSFEAWLKNTRPLSLENGTLVVAVPNRWVRQWLNDRLVQDLLRAVEEATGHHLELRFVVQEQETAAAAEPTPAAPVQPAYRPASAGQPLNPKYTFDSFVIGSSNRLAHAAALAVAEAPARAYNPLFLYGGVGLGKTHLMQAVAHHVLQKNPQMRAVYISSETFTNEMINSIRDSRTVEFRTRYRNVDILLVDDIQFLAGKESTQEEFFHTFNALHEANHQIVLSSDRPPKDIPTLEERLRSRFEWGLISDIQAPDLETRIAILRKKAQIEQLHVPDEVIYYIAQRVTSNIRELEGALIRLVAHASLVHSPITPDLAAHTLKDLLPQPPQGSVSIGDIQHAVAEHFGLKVKDFKVRNRARSISFPRQIAMYLCRELTDSSLPKIGAEFGGRDHTTVLHACEKIRSGIAHEEELRGTVNSLRATIRHSS